MPIIFQMTTFVSFNGIVYMSKPNGRKVAFLWCIGRLILWDFVHFWQWQKLKVNLRKCVILTIVTQASACRKSNVTEWELRNKSSGGERRRLLCGQFQAGARRLFWGRIFCSGESESLIEGKGQGCRLMVLALAHCHQHTHLSWRWMWPLPAPKWPWQA